MTTTAKPKAAKAKKSTKAVKSTGLKIDVQSADIIGIDTPALVVNLFRGVKKPGGATGAVDKALGGVITQLSNDLVILAVEALGFFSENSFGIGLGGKENMARL